MYFHWVESHLDKHDALNAYANNAIHWQGEYRSRHMYNEFVRPSVSVKFMDDVIRLYVEKKREMPENVCKRFVTHRKNNKLFKIEYRVFLNLMMRRHL